MDGPLLKDAEALFCGTLRKKSQVFSVELPRYTLYNYQLLVLIESLEVDTGG